MAADGAVQIIATADDGSMELKKDALKKILDDKEHADKDIVVLSVAGVFRGVKSFLLGFFLRFLESEGKAGWIGDKNATLQGFSWATGSKRHTTGIWAWKKLFTLPDLPKVAIMLLDTQGLFDNDATMKVSAKVFGLSVMVSSIQIYNLSKTISEDNLQHLQFFTAYGRHAEDKKMDKRPFQSLIFLIRDWQNQQEFNFGWKGGEKYLESVLKKETSPKNAELLEVRTHIERYFENIRCFLMPRPGDVIENPSFKGETRQMRQDFVEQLQELTKKLFQKPNLFIKKNNGEDVKCSQMYGIFEEYIRAFSGEALPEPTTLFKATADLYNQKAISNAREYFRTEMKKKFGPDQPYVEIDELKRIYDLIRDESLQMFRTAPKLGDHETERTLEEDLGVELDIHYDEFVKNNDNKRPLLSLIKSYLGKIRGLQYVLPVVTWALFSSPEVTLPLMALGVVLTPLFIGDHTGMLQAWFESYSSRQNSPLQETVTDNPDLATPNQTNQREFPVVAFIKSMAKIVIFFILIRFLWTIFSSTFNMLLTLVTLVSITYLFRQQIYTLSRRHFFA